jgi:HSP20 family protein
MSNLTRWNPLREMAAMQRAMDRMFEDAWNPFVDGESLRASGLALDVSENENAYTLTTEIPGVKPEDIHIRLDHDMLTIEGEFRDETNEEKDGRPIVKERRYGRYSRSIRLPQAVDEGQIEAIYDNGVLKLVLPKSPEAQPKLISVQTGKYSR